VAVREPRTCPPVGGVQGAPVVEVALVVVVVVTGALGMLYLAGAAVLGGVFIALAIVNLRNQRQRWSRLLFDYSSAYLGLLFAVMLADRMIGRL